MASLFKKGPFWYLEFKDRNAVWRNRSTGLRWNDPKETKQAYLVRANAESPEIANEIKKVSREGWDWVDEFLQGHCVNEKTLARYLVSFLAERGRDQVSARTGPQWDCRNLVHPESFGIGRGSW